MPELRPSKPQHAQLNDLDLSGIDPALLEPIRERRPATNGSGASLGLFILSAGLTLALSVGPAQTFLALKLGSVGSVALPLALALVTMRLLWSLLQKRAERLGGTRGPSFGERLQRFSKFEPWLAAIGLLGALTLKVTNTGKGYEAGIGIMAIAGGIFGALWLSRQIERRVDP